MFFGQALFENVDAPTLREHQIGEAYRNKVRERMYLARDTHEGVSSTNIQSS